jgi:high-affinity iron transporter
MAVVAWNGTVISYNLYWLVIIITFLFMRYKEKKPSSVPVAADNEKGNSSDDASSQEGRAGTAEKGAASEIRPIAS